MMSDDYGYCMCLLVLPEKMDSLTQPSPKRPDKHCKIKLNPQDKVRDFIRIVEICPEQPPKDGEVIYH